MNTSRTLRVASALVLGLGAAIASGAASAQYVPVYPQQGAIAAPASPHLIQRFYVAQGYGIQAGRELVFVLVGQPGGNAWVNLPSGMQMPLAEVQPGEYQGRYVVQWGDNPQALMQVFGALQVANMTTTTQLENRAAAASVAPRGRAYGRRQ
jgi:hypothetical protein